MAGRFSVRTTEKRAVATTHGWYRGIDLVFWVIVAVCVYAALVVNPLVLHMFGG